MSKAWKELERITALKFGGVRQFNKGTHNVEDVVHPRFVIECKSRVSFSFKAWWEQAYKQVKRKANNGKIALLVCKQKSQVGEFVILKTKDFHTLINEARLDSEWVSDAYLDEKIKEANGNDVGMPRSVLTLSQQKKYAGELVISDE